MVEMYFLIFLDLEFQDQGAAMVDFFWSLWLIDDCLRRGHSSMHVCGLISPFHKDTSPIGLDPTLMTSF